MVEYRYIIAVFTLVCLIFIFGNILYPTAPSPDPIIGDWLYSSPGGGYTYISINSSGEFDERSVSNIVGPYERRISLAPIHGTWKRQWNGTYSLNSSGRGIRLLEYSTSQDLIYDKDGHGYSRYNASV